MDKLSGIGVGAALAANERDHAESEASPCGYRATSIRSLAATAVLLVFHHEASDGDGLVDRHTAPDHTLHSPRPTAQV